MEVERKAVKVAKISMKFDFDANETVREGDKEVNFAAAVMPVEDAGVVAKEVAGYGFFKKASAILRGCKKTTAVPRAGFAEERPVTEGVVYEGIGEVELMATAGEGLPATRIRLV